MNPPAFQFYVDDFLGGTLNFTDSELGLYARLLCVQWSAGSLVDDDDELISYSKGGTPLVRVKKKFKKCSDGKLRNTRMEIERKKQKAFRKSRSENGKLGGRPRKASENLVVLKDEAKKSSPSPSPSPLKSKSVTLDEVKLCCAKTGLPESDAVWFWNKCEANGWTNGGKPIKSWPHTIASWKAAGYMPSQKNAVTNGQQQPRQQMTDAEILRGAL